MEAKPPGWRRMPANVPVWAKTVGDSETLVEFSFCLSHYLDSPDLDSGIEDNRNRWQMVLELHDIFCHLHGFNENDHWAGGDYLSELTTLFDAFVGCVKARPGWIKENYEPRLETILGLLARNPHMVTLHYGANKSEIYEEVTHVLAKMLEENPDSVEAERKKNAPNSSVPKPA